MDNTASCADDKTYRDLWDAGMHVFPLYGATRDEHGDWRCDCGNPDCGAPFKHPRARNWQVTPHWDEEQLDNIEEAGWLKTGYGVLCKGLLVIDIDSRNGGQESYARLVDAIPEVAGAGMIVETGRGDGGKHLYFSLPDAVPMVTHLPGMPGLDAKSSGYVVGPGSLHASGGRYRIVYGGPDDIEPAPQALIDLLRKPERHRAEYEGRSVDVSHADIADMLAHIDPDCPYDQWIRIGMAVHHSTGGTGLALWDAWSARGDKYDPDKMEAHWHSFGRSANPATLGTIIHFAEAGGWVWPVSFGTPAEPQPATDEVVSESSPETVAYDPTRPPGYTGEIAAWIESQNRRPRARASVGAALWVTSCLFANWTDDLDAVNLNLMAFIVAGSGSGKDSIQKAATRLLRIAGLAPAVHGTIKSEKEIVENLLRHQVSHYNIDEVGELLMKIQNAKRRGGAAHHEGTIGMLMSAYSKADGHLLIGGDRKEEVRAALLKEASGLQKKIDEGTADEALKASPRLAAVRRALDSIDQGIERPYLTLIGFTVPQTFDQLMDYETATNGFMRRAILFQEHDTAPRTKSGFVRPELPERMDALVRTMASSGVYDPDDGGRIELLPLRKVISTTTEAAGLLRQAVVWFDDQAVAHKSKSGMEALYLGAYEQVSRISALLACWEGVRNADHVRWAFETVRRDVQAKALAVTANDRAKDSPQTALQARLVSLCGGEAGMTLGVLVNRCRAFRRDDVEREVKALVTVGALRSESVKGGNGKTVERLIAN